MADEGRASGETPRGAAQKLRSGGVRMGKPGKGHTLSSITEYIGYGREPAELKHLSKPRKRNRRDSVSSGERKRNSLNSDACVRGLWDGI